MLPDVTIVTTTWFPEEHAKERFSSAVEAISSWSRNCKYEGELRLHIADDGSIGGEVLCETLGNMWGRDSWSKSYQERRGVGASLNAGFKQAFLRSALALYIVDDWKLTQPLDITPWVRLLLADESIGMVRLGIAHPDLTGQVKYVSETGEYYLRLDRHHFAFAHRPALYHKRFLDAYGPFAERVNAFECERLYNERFAQQPGPDIALALLHSWRHISDIELADVEPAAEVRA